MKLTGREAQRIPLGELLRVSAEHYGTAPFVVQAETGEQLSYVEFNQQVNKIAHGLQSTIGIAKDDYVGIMLGSSIKFLASSYALKKLGAVEVSMNTNFRGVALSRMLNLTACESLITSKEFLEALIAVKDELVALNTLILIDGLEEARALFPTYKILAFNDIISDDISEPQVQIRDDETAVILFTSGTTGVSKGCAIPHRSSVRAAESMIEAFDLTSEDAVYTPYPQFHVGASQYDILPAMMVGARVILRDGFSLTNFWKDVSTYAATWFMCLGSVQQLLWSEEPCEEENQHSLRFMWGTPLPVDADAFEKRFNLKLARGGGYGSTDAGSVALPLFDKVGAGTVLDRYEVAIVDEHDDILPVGEVGELVIRPIEPAIMASEYVGMAERTIKAWRNLWFHSGDLAKLDDEGDLFWIARKTERIRVKGEMVSAYEIEEVILTHPSVKDCAVIGMPDGIGEEIVLAVVSLKDSASLSLADLKTFCQGKMSRFMLPTQLEIFLTLPRTPTGKVAKAELKQILVDKS